MSVVSPERSSSIVQNQDNLSIETLVDKASGVQGIEKLWKDFDSCCKLVRQYRNKLVAHNDLKAALQIHDNLVPNITRPTIDSILLKASTLMNCVYNFYAKGDISFEPHEIGGGKVLVFWLQRACEQRPL